MKPIYKGLIIALTQVCIVSVLGAKLLYDRATCPRVWALTAPYDPNLPIRGRYVRLQLVVDTRGFSEPTSTTPAWTPPQSAILQVENDRLVALPDPDKSYRSEGAHIRFIQRQDRKLTVLAEPVAYFIPEHVPDPSRRPAGEELWAEVTLPRKGPPRPIRLGVKTGDGPIVPMEMN